MELKLLGKPISRGLFEFLIDGARPVERDSFEATFKVEVPATNLTQLVKQLAPCSDTRIRVVEDGSTTIAVNPNDWINCPPHDLLDRLISVQPKLLQGYLSTLMRPILNERNETIGRAAIWPTLSYTSQTGVLVAKGFRVQPIPHLAGVLMGEVETAVRNSGNTLFDKVAFKAWASEQASLVLKTAIPDETKAYIAEVVLEFGGSIGDLPIMQRNEEWFTLKEMRKKLRQLDNIVVYVGSIDHDDDDEVSTSSFENSLEINPQLFIIPTISASFTVDSSRSKWRRGRASYLLQVFKLLLGDAWKKGWEEDDDELTVVGDVNGTEILRRATTYSRR
ncbi:hypothetical protein [Neorhizobium galegae]|uniref:hypothetical protein n=1 Tax=Neorhizobium galegae TaxID=399 RepID=UPI000627A543|nr:hypothetical protein [Neorhizobium galegae]KAB1120019.1 hypothetical protein F4V90_31155 [Neorhizobium galegae]MCQ1810640.1 hypothetical protein [Neorhizobium galegae]